MIHTAAKVDRRHRTLRIITLVLNNQPYHFCIVVLSEKEAFNQSEPLGIPRQQLQVPRNV